MIKRSVPITLLVKSDNPEYAEGIKDGIMYALEVLLHECDVIMRVSPYVYKHEDGEHWMVRSRFTARSKAEDRARGEWIKIHKAYYEEEINDHFETAGLTEEAENK
jgi:hypothetical protein